MRRKRFNHKAGAVAALFAVTFVSILAAVFMGIALLITNDHLGIAAGLLLSGLGAVVYLAAGKEVKR